MVKSLCSCNPSLYFFVCVVAVTKLLRERAKRHCGCDVKAIIVKVNGKEIKYGQRFVEIGKARDKTEYDINTRNIKWQATTTTTRKRPRQKVRLHNDFGLT